MNAKRLFEWQVVFWGIFFLCHIAAGLYFCMRLRMHLFTYDSGPTSSSDAYFLDTLNVSNGVKTVEKCVENLPPGSKVAVVYRIGSYQTLPGQMTCLAIWQRGHVAVEVSADARETRDELRAKQPAAIFWIDGEPPDWLPELKPLSHSFAYGPYVPGK